MKRVLVTGGASGIGAALVRQYAQDGARVVIADVDEAAGKAVAAETGGLFVPTDVTDQQANFTAVDAAMQTFGGLDVAHLNAASASGGGLGEYVDDDAYRRTLAVNIDGTVFGVRAAWPALAAAGGGAIVVTASVAGLTPAPFAPAYAATKHAIIGLVRSYAPLLTEYRININAVCPGFVNTPMLDNLREHVSAQGLAIAEPAEIAAAMCTVAGQDSTGGAWVAQAGRAPEQVRFPEIELSRA